MVVLLACVIEETVDLNWNLTEDGNYQKSEREFIPDLSSDHDAIIRAWDGEDYIVVTIYDIIEC